MRDKRVLVVVRWPVGGIRTWLRYVLSHELFRRYQIVIAAANVPEARLLRSELPFPSVSWLPMPDKTGPFFAAVARTVLGGRYDLIHSQGFTSAVAASLALEIVDVPHLVTQHDVILEDQYVDLKGRVARAMIERALRKATRVHSVSESAANNLRASFPRVRDLAAKSAVIVNGIDVERFRSAAPVDLRAELGLGDDAFVIGFFGRFMGQKGFRYVIEAMETLARARPNGLRPVLVAVGDGGFKEQEERAVRSRGLDASIRFLGFRPDIGGLMKGTDAVIMPSLWEACGLVAMEVLTAGVPLLISDCDALLEVTAGFPVERVERANAASLAEGIARLMARPDKQAALAAAPRAVERFDATKAAVGLASLYERMLGTAARPASAIAAESES